MRFVRPWDLNLEPAAYNSLFVTVYRRESLDGCDQESNKDKSHLYELMFRLVGRQRGAYGGSGRRDRSIEEVVVSGRSVLFTLVRLSVIVAVFAVTLGVWTYETQNRDEIVNGFQTMGSGDVYSIVMRKALTQLPSGAVITYAGLGVGVIKARAAQEVQNDRGLRLVWTIAPAPGFLEVDRIAQRCWANAAVIYLMDLVTKSKSQYTALLQTHHLPVKDKDLDHSWAVRVQTRNKSGALDYFQIAIGPHDMIASWSNALDGLVPLPNRSQNHLRTVAPIAVANLLLSSRAVAS